MTRTSLIPPPDIRMCVGPFKNSRIYRESSVKSAQHFIHLCNVQSDAIVLDIGCGCGRVASALTSHLQPPGRYEGFDVSDSLLQWCKKHITPHFPHFRFQLADVVAGAHNPTGKLPPSEFTFPYPANTFDAALASSVFTHMLPAGVESYVTEIARVLKPGGRLLVSHLLINAEALRAVEEGTTIFDLRHEFGPCRTFDPHTPEEGVAYEEGYVRTLFEQNGLDVQEPIHYGTWRNKRSYMITHDWLVVLKK